MSSKISFSLVSRNYIRRPYFYVTGIAPYGRAGSVQASLVVRGEEFRPGFVRSVRGVSLVERDFVNGLSWEVAAEHLI